MAEASFWIDVWTLKFVDDMSGIANDEAELQLKAHLMMEKFKHCFPGMGICLSDKMWE